MYKGVVLAGGLATRLPNKPLLPLRNHKPAITSGIDFLKRSGVNDVVVVVPPNSAIPRVLASFGYGPRFCVQEHATGVCGAVAAAAPWLNPLSDDDRVVVTYCDNVYGESSKLSKIDASVANGHSVMFIDDPVKSHGLSKYSDGTWVHDSKSNLCVAGWMLLDRRGVELADGAPSTEQLMNCVNGVPIRVDDPEWYDIGTVMTYAAYWEALR
jgi:dTDP-glucose pyrophosphorylase